MNRASASGIVFLSLLPALTRADDSPLSLTDLAGYRAALTDRKETKTAPIPVTFRDLWDHPELYQDRLVQVQGRIVRSFRQGAVGTFPPLVEAWAVSPAGDPFCLVYPAPSQKKTPTPADPILFRGTFLRRIRYQGGDEVRLAPLIVGSRPPELASKTPAPVKPPASSLSWLDWSVGLATALVVALVLAWQHARMPIRRSREPEIGIPPSFIEAPHEGSDRGDGQIRSMDEEEWPNDVT